MGKLIFLSSLTCPSLAGRRHDQSGVSLLPLSPPEPRLASRSGHLDHEMEPPCQSQPTAAVQNSVIVLHVLRAPSARFPASQPLASGDAFPGSVVLPLTGWRAVGIPQCVVLDACSSPFLGCVCASSPVLPLPR